jgi:hypothetical protein
VPVVDHLVRDVDPHRRAPLEVVGRPRGLTGCRELSADFETDASVRAGDDG